MRTLLECCLLAATCLLMVFASAMVGAIEKRAAPIQQDEATEEETNRLDLPQVELSLIPADKVDLMEGDDITFECTIRNKPRNSQLQWYYMIRNPVDNSFDNFTILANEVATVNKDKYSVWTTPPGLYTMQIDRMNIDDSGEYCCFLYVSYSESYRDIATVTVHQKLPPPTTQRSTTSSPEYRQPHPPSRGVFSNRGLSLTSPQYSQAGSHAIDDIIEEVVEHDIEEKLGKKLNITMIKNNPEARTLIHNATEEIKSLLNFEDASGMQFTNDSTKLTVTRKMQGASSQVKTVVTTLIHRISNVDAQLAEALAPLYNNGGGSGGRINERPGVSAGVSYAAGRYGGERTGVPDWRTLYNEYKRGRGDSPVSQLTSANAYVEPEARSYNHISNTPEVTNPQDIENDERLEIAEEQTNSISSQPETSGRKKCEYQIVINEFDPSQCPSIGSNRGAPAAVYYEAENRKAAAAFTQEPVGNAQPQYSNDQLSRIEDKLIEEMANSKMVNKTVLMHDGMLQKTEKMMEQQTQNLTKLERELKDLKGLLASTEEEKLDMEEKLTNVMLNILEVNKRLDVAMNSQRTGYYGKEIDVLSASETVTCDRHPNVTFYKDCAELAMEEAAPSGVYYIRPLYSACPVPVWCDMDTYPGGWTVVQRRENGAVTFNRGWEQYRKGFGHVTSEHWLGNDNLFLLSNQEQYMLRVDLWDFYDSRVYAEYRTFKVDGERDGYKLSVANYSGTAGDGFKTHNKQKFSTSDRDQDLWKDYHCAYEWEGGWWFTNCWSSYLNGPYYNVSDPPYNGISWRQWKEEQLSKSEMKIRPVFHILNEEQADAEAQDQPTVEPEPGLSTNGAKSLQGDQPRQDINNRQRHKMNMAIVE